MLRARPLSSSVPPPSKLSTLSRLSGCCWGLGARESWRADTRAGQRDGEGRERSSSWYTRAGTEGRGREGRQESSFSHTALWLGSRVTSLRVLHMGVAREGPHLQAGMQG